MVTSFSGPQDGANIVAYRGDTFQRWIRITRNGVGMSFDDNTIRIQVRKGNSLILELFSAVHIFTDGDGVLKLLVSAEVMAALIPGTYDYDAQQQFTSPAIVKTLFRGTFSITDDITKIA